jgi:biotin transport system substrate-specific component
MSTAVSNSVLSEEFWSAEGNALWVKRVVLVALGIVALAIAAKIKVPIWPSPVPITLGTFAVLTIGTAYGPRMGLATILGYMLIGALGFDVFANSAAGTTGIEYMMGGTGGYLVGYVLATLALGYAARLGWDRNVLMLAAGMFIGSLIIYVPGVMWLAHLYTWENAFAWGVTPFLIGDAMKLVLAALIVPGVWKFVGKARG